MIVESPTFIGALWFFRGLGINTVGVDTDALGIVPSSLRETVTHQRRAGAQVSLVYTMPTVHNPVGFNAPVERRRELAEVGEELDLVFLEDDAYGDLIFDGDRPPALYAIAGRERVIKLGTLSKLVAGGMRLGWAIAEPDDISRMCGLKADSATGPFAAWVTGAYLQSGALARRLPTLLNLYRTRRDAMLEELAPLRDVGLRLDHTRRRLLHLAGAARRRRQRDHPGTRRRERRHLPGRPPLLRRRPKPPLHPPRLQLHPRRPAPPRRPPPSPNPPRRTPAFRFDLARLSPSPLRRPLHSPRHSGVFTRNPVPIPRRHPRSW